MNTKKLVGSSAYFTINKEIITKVGLEAALLLQHLIDIEDAYFQGISFYQSEKRLIKDTYLTVRQLRRAKIVLSDSGAVTLERGGDYNGHTFKINHEAIWQWFNIATTSSDKNAPVVVQKSDRLDKESRETKKQEDKLKNSKKIYDVLVKVYPKNRINSSAPILKYLDKRSNEELKLIVKNVKPYLDIAGDYVKNLRNYLEHECWTDEWIPAETKTKNTGKTNGNKSKNNAESFNNRNKGFYD